MIVKRTVRLYPTESQKAYLHACFTADRWCYNQYVAEKTRLEAEYQELLKTDPDAKRKSLSNLSFDKVLRQKRASIDSTVEGFWESDEYYIERCLLLLPSDSIYYPTKDVFGSFKLFFSNIKRGVKASPPKFKNWRNRCSFVIRKAKITENYIQLPTTCSNRKLKYRDAFDLSTKKSKPIRIVYRAGNYYASVTIDIDFAATKAEKELAGIDWGIAQFATVVDQDDNVERIDLPMQKILAYEKRIARLQKELSRKKKGSANRKKLVLRLQQAHQKLANLRKHHQHELTTDLIRTYQGISVEDLNLRGMTRSAKGTKDQPGTNVAAKSGLNRAILRSAPGQMYDMLKYKAKAYGRELQFVDPKYTSQTCPECGCVDKKNRKGNGPGSFVCVSCGYTNDADVVGAMNIRNKSLV